MSKSMIFKGIAWSTLLGFLIVVPGCGSADEERGFTVEEMDSDLDNKVPESSAKPTLSRFDADGDGWSVWADCNDADAEVYPRAVETCNGRDDNCNGAVDDDAVDASPWYPDADRDGYGEGEPVWACYAPAGYVGVEGDCDDSSADVFPGAPATCDGVDTNCDGSNVDEEWYCSTVDEPIGEDSSTYDPGNGDGANEPSTYDPGNGDGATDPSNFAVDAEWADWY